MKYSALTIAKFIIRYCEQNNKRVSNLKLQKLLYFVWRDYFKDTNQELFDEPFCAWKFGAVVSSVYYEYCSFGYLDIWESVADRGNDLGILDDDKQIIEKAIDKYNGFTAEQLVEETHKDETPWSLTYNGGAGNKMMISSELIKNEARSIQDE